jgi:hypothetical protein
MNGVIKYDDAFNRMLHITLYFLLLIISVFFLSFSSAPNYLIHVIHVRSIKYLVIYYWVQCNILYKSSFSTSVKNKTNPFCPSLLLLQIQILRQTKIVTTLIITMIIEIVVIILIIMIPIAFMIRISMIMSTLIIITTILRIISGHQRCVEHSEGRASKETIRSHSYER